MLRSILLSVIAVALISSIAVAGIYGEVDHVNKDGIAHNDYIVLASKKMGSVAPTYLGVISKDGWWESCAGITLSPTPWFSAIVLGGLDSDSPHWHYVILPSFTLGDFTVTNAYENGGGGPGNRFVANGPSGISGLRVGVMAQIGQGYGPRVDYTRGHWGGWAAVVQNGEHSVWHTALNWSR